jgi:hypothetical protein
MVSDTISLRLLRRFKSSLIALFVGLCVVPMVALACSIPPSRPDPCARGDFNAWAKDTSPYRLALEQAGFSFEHANGSLWVGTPDRKYYLRAHPGTERFYMFDLVYQMSQETDLSIQFDFQNDQYLIGKTAVPFVFSGVPCVDNISIFSDRLEQRIKFDTQDHIEKFNKNQGYENNFPQIGYGRCPMYTYPFDHYDSLIKLGKVKSGKVVILMKNSDQTIGIKIEDVYEGISGISFSGYTKQLTVFYDLKSFFSAKKSSNDTVALFYYSGKIKSN